MIKLAHDAIDKEDISALCSWLSQDPTPQLTKGELTVQLEKEWAAKLGTKHCVYVNSGSSAILLTLAALLHTNRLKNNKVVTSGLSWATDVSSPILLGMEPILCDCNLTDLSCDLFHLESIFINEKPAVLILVSPLGLVPQMDRIINLCKQYDVILLEDCCESAGSKFKNAYLGSFGLASFFSLFFGHHFSTLEGGFINTSDEDLYHSLVMMRSHGWDRDLPVEKQQELRNKYKVSSFDALYNFYLPGFNVRATDLQAFLGLRTTKKLDWLAERRKNNFNVYLRSINNDLILDNDPDNFISNFAFPILSHHKMRIVKKLENAQIQCRPLIAGDMSQKPMWTRTYGKLDLPNCQLINKFGFYIPNHQNLTETDISQICKTINSIV